jgi:hypothetical protein
MLLYETWEDVLDKILHINCMLLYLSLIKKTLFVTNNTSIRTFTIVINADQLYINVIRFKMVIEKITNLRYTMSKNNMPRDT